MTRIHLKALMVGLFGLALASCGTDTTGSNGDCTSQASTTCSGGVTYWADSCGNQEDFLAVCGSGCNADATGCADAVGAFTVELNVDDSGERYTTMSGSVFDGPQVPKYIWTVQESNTTCRLVTPTASFCDPACTGGMICVGDNLCQGDPTRVSVGTVNVEGLSTTGGETSFSLREINATYQMVNVGLSYPPFSEGDTVTVSAEGEGAASAFTLQSNGITHLEVSNETIELARNQALTLTWTAPTQSNASQIYVELDISHHGGFKGQIECEAPDNGSLEIPADMVSALIDLGTAGFPSITVARKAVGSAETTYGPVDLEIISSVTKLVEIPGNVSCNESNPCPTGQTCNDDLMLCE